MIIYQPKPDDVCRCPVRNGYTTDSPRGDDMRIAITGATGLIGTALSKSLAAEGAEILAVTRRVGPLSPGLTRVHWDPEKAEIESSALEGVDVVFHLAGESIGQRWTGARKERIRKSRVEGTRLLVDGLGKLARPPAALMSASGINFYGDGGDEELRESSPPGDGYLPELCQAWEAEAARASEFGARTVSLRTGLVLSARGGALAKMLLPFKLGLGGPLGSGKQWMSWIHIEDIVGAYRFAMDRQDIRGPLNATAPQPVRQRDFAKALGKALGRPAVVPTPGFAMRLAFGEMGQTLLLEGQKVLPHRLQQAGYSFRHPELDESLEDVLTHSK